MNGIAMMLFALGLLVLPGALYNNLNNSGLTVLGNVSPTTCDTTLDICTYPSNVAIAAPQGGTGAGCQNTGGVLSNQCLLTNNVAASFLSGSSPFTQILAGNIGALFGNLNAPLGSGATNAPAQSSWCGLTTGFCSHGPFDITGNPVYYSANCQVTNATASLSQTLASVGMCTQATTDGKNVTKASTTTWTNWNTSWNSTVPLMFYNLGNGTYTRSCAFIAQINYTLLGNSGYTYFRCGVAQGRLLGPPQGAPTTRSWGYLVAIPVSYGAMPKTHHGAFTHIVAFAQLTSWYTIQCVQNIQLGYYGSAGCENFKNGFKGYTIPGTAITFVPNSAAAIIFGMIAGIILLLGGLGLQIGFGGGVSAGVNRQGTKLFQVLGIGLIVWSFMFSEFGTWYSSGNLPFGLDGSFGVIGSIITGIFFIGVWTWGTTA